MGEVHTETRRLEIVNERGLHARASAKVVELTDRFSCEAVIRHDGERADPASIMDLLTLAAPCGAHIEVSATGGDAIDYLDALEELVRSRFGEER